ncbi:MAG: hypothetical protein RL148_519 [Planctomycetota bacterium]|jgi:hypothetical protein
MNPIIRGAVVLFSFGPLCAAAAGEDPPAKDIFRPAEPISYRAGSGITFDGGDEFRLNLLNRLQVQYLHSFGADERNGSGSWLDDSEGNNQDFEVRRARTRFSGHAYNPHIRFQVEMDWAEEDQEGSLLDAWVQWNFFETETESIGLRFGQGKTHFGLEATGTSAGLAMVERSIASKFFATERSQGAWLNGSYAEGALRWFAGVQDSFVSAGLERFMPDLNTTADNEVVYVASLQLDILGDYLASQGSQDYESANQGDVSRSNCLLGTIGGSYAYDDRGVGTLELPSSEVLEARDNRSWSANTAWRYAGWWATGEYFFAQSDLASDFGREEKDNDGYHVAVNYTLPKSGDSNLQWGLGVRYADLDLSSVFGSLLPGGVDARSVDQIGGVLTAYLRGHGCKVQAELNRTSYSDQDVDQLLIQVSLVL